LLVFSADFMGATNEIRHKIAFQSFPALWGEDPIETIRVLPFNSGRSFGASNYRNVLDNP
jgi:hypothetical protein